MKKKNLIYYVILNLLLTAFVGFLIFRLFFPVAKVYPQAVNIFSKELAYGEELHTVKAMVADQDEEMSTYHFTITNDSEKEKIYYLFLEVTGDQELINAVTIKIKDRSLLISYLPNMSVKTITLAPHESLDITMKVYIDEQQVLDTSIFTDKKLTVQINDDYVSFYGIIIEE